MNLNGSILDPLTYQDYSILIVDDTLVNLAMMVEYLEGYGFAIRVARIGKTALRSIQYDPPDLILLDILMPGIEALKPAVAYRQMSALARFR